MEPPKSNAIGNTQIRLRANSRAVGKNQSRKGDEVIPFVGDETRRALLGL